MSVANACGDDEEDNEDKENTMRHNWYDDQFPYNMDITTGHVILVSNSILYNDFVCKGLVIMRC